jgi:hypothetical protein
MNHNFLFKLDRHTIDMEFVIQDDTRFGDSEFRPWNDCADVYFYGQLTA